LQTKRGRKKTTDDATGTTVGGIRAATGIYLAEEVVEPAEEDKTRARTDEIFTLFWGAGLIIGCSKSPNRRSSNARARAREISISIVPAGRHRSTQSRDDSPAV